MSTSTQLRLVASRQGRVFLHVVMLAHDHKIKWHSKGIWREIIFQGKANPFVA